MSKKITVSFYDALLADYFGGHHKPVLQVTVDGNTTRKDIYSFLLSELAMGVIDYQIEENRLDYAMIFARQSMGLSFYEEWMRSRRHAFPHLLSLFSI